MKKEWQKDIEIIKNCLQNLDIEKHEAHTIFYKEYTNYIKYRVLKIIRSHNFPLSDIPGTLDVYAHEILIDLLLKGQLEKYNPDFEKAIHPKSWINLITYKKTLNLIRKDLKGLDQKVCIEDIILIDNLSPDIFLQFLALIELIEKLPPEKSSLLLEKFSKQESIKNIAKKLKKKPNTVTQMIRRIVQEIADDFFKD